MSGFFGSMIDPGNIMGKRGDGSINIAGMINPMGEPIEKLTGSKIGYKLVDPFGISGPSVNETKDRHSDSAKRAVNQQYKNQSDTSYMMARDKYRASGMLSSSSSGQGISLLRG
jgi:hypothetical protein